MWGPFLDTDFTKWEKNEVERTHTQFLKRILGCDIHTSNIMTRTEVGRRPMLIDIIKRNVLFIQHIKLDPNSLVFAALDVENESRFTTIEVEKEPSNEAAPAVENVPSKDNTFNLIDRFDLDQVEIARVHHPTDRLAQHPDGLAPYDKVDQQQ